MLFSNTLLLLIAMKHLQSCEIVQIAMPKQGHPVLCENFLKNKVHSMAVKQ